ncbi:MAG: hypothetical protein OXC44_01800 [Proteobacteria bacterium]|nr:hypothetical protein [Pseudomonadota bacterium]
MCCCFSLPAYGDDEYLLDIDQSAHFSTSLSATFSANLSTKQPATSDISTQLASTGIASLAIPPLLLRLYGKAGLPAIAQHIKCRQWCVITPSLAMLSGYVYRAWRSNVVYNDQVFMSRASDDNMVTTHSVYDRYGISQPPEPEGSKLVGWAPDPDHMDADTKEKYLSLLEYINEEGVEHSTYLEKYLSTMLSMNNPKQIELIQRNLNYTVLQRQLNTQTPTQTLGEFYLKQASRLVTIRSKIQSLKYLISLADTHLLEDDLNAIHNRLDTVFTFFNNADILIHEAQNIKGIAKLAGLQIGYVQLSAYLFHLHRNFHMFSKFLHNQYPKIYEALNPALNSLITHLSAAGEDALSLEKNSYYSVHKMKQKHPKRMGKLIKELSENNTYQVNIIDDENTIFKPSREIFYSQTLDHILNAFFKNMYYLSEITYKHRIPFYHHLEVIADLLDPDIRLKISILVLEENMHDIAHIFFANMTEKDQDIYFTNNKDSRKDLLTKPSNPATLKSPYSRHFVHMVGETLQLTKAIEQSDERTKLWQKMIPDFDIEDVMYLADAKIPDEVLANPKDLDKWIYATEIFELTNTMLYYAITALRSKKLQSIYDELAFEEFISQYYSRRQIASELSSTNLDDLLTFKKYIAQHASDYNFLDDDTKTLILESYPYLIKLHNNLINASKDIL